MLICYNEVMRIYFSGIGGVGIGPLAEIALDAGYQVVGSDRDMGPMAEQLQARGVEVSNDQSGDFLRAHHQVQPFDWLVYTAALPSDHPELLAAKELGIKTAKRDELLAHIIAEKNLKLVAVAGTHGKTTTTGMMVWAMKQLGLAVSYSVGAALSYGPSGVFDPDSQYFVYECDEFDRNFLHFHPWLSLVTSVGYDHTDVFESVDDYRAAFRQFGQQSSEVITWQDLADVFVDQNLSTLEKADERITLVGQHNRMNATLVMEAIAKIAPKLSQQQIIEAINSFPGTSRRFEKIADNLISDYGHHPTEIAATLKMAREVSDSVVLVYQPHQNVRQHQVCDLYTDCMELADEIYWLPTYLTREDPNLEVLTPADLTKNLTNKSAVKIADLNDQLVDNINSARAAGKLVVCMGAGSIDDWVRKNFIKS